MSLQIDWSRCDGHGLCAELAPSLITRDDWGFPLIDRAAVPDEPGQLRRAVAFCPALALRLTATDERTE